MPRTKCVNVEIPLRDDEPAHVDGKRDFSAHFNCPFPIFSEDEGIIFRRLNKLTVTPPYLLEWSAMDDLKIREPLTEHLKNLSLYDFATHEYVGYKELCLEMLCTLNVDNRKSVMTCRFLGKEYTITLDMMNKVFGFSSEMGASKVRPKRFNVEEAWKQLSGLDNWSSNNVSSGFIKDPVLAILHKFMAYNVSGKKEANKVNANEVFFLWAAQGNHKVCIASFIWKHMVNIQKHCSYHPSMSSIATGLAIELQLIIPLPKWSKLDPGYIGFLELKNGRLIEDKFTFVAFENRPCVKEHFNAEAAKMIFSERGDRGESSHGNGSGQEQNIEIRPSAGHEAILEYLESFKTALFNRLDTQDDSLLSMNKRLKTLEKKWSDIHPSASPDEGSNS